MHVLFAINEYSLQLLQPNLASGRYSWKLWVQTDHESTAKWGLIQNPIQPLKKKGRENESFKWRSLGGVGGMLGLNKCEGNDRTQSVPVYITPWDFMCGTSWLAKNKILCCRSFADFLSTCQLSAMSSCIFSIVQLFQFYCLLISKLWINEKRLLNLETDCPWDNPYIKTKKKVLYYICSG